MAVSRFPSVRARRRRRAPAFSPLAAAAIALFVVGFGGVQALPLLEQLGIDLPSLTLEPDTEVVGTAARTRFPICSGSGRYTCVVDGDTFWFEGETIRIADINTPETGQPECESERALGRQATTRLVQLLEAGPFELVRSGTRDEDQYGRKLRIVMRNGQSLGEVLIAENLAHRWEGRRESWCA